MANVASIGNFQRIGFSRRNEFEGVAADVGVGELLRDLWHVARHAFISGAAGRMVGVRLNCRRTRPIGRSWTVTLETHHIDRL